MKKVYVPTLFVFSLSVTPVELIGQINLKCAFWSEEEAKEFGIKALMSRQNGKSNIKFISSVCFHYSSGDVRKKIKMEVIAYDIVEPQKQIDYGTNKS